MMFYDFDKRRVKELQSNESTIKGNKMDYVISDIRGDGNILVKNFGNDYRKYGIKLGCLCLDTMEEFYV